MISAILATMLAMATPQQVDMAMRPVQRAEVLKYVRDYNRAVQPVYGQFDRIPEDGFYPGQKSAVNTSRVALDALAACPRTMAAIRALTPPQSVPKADQARFTKYAQQKLQVYRYHCAYFKALVAYVDNPYKSSAEAALMRASEASSRPYTVGRRAVAPAFARLGLRLPKSW